MFKGGSIIHLVCEPLKDYYVDSCRFSQGPKIVVLRNGPERDPGQGDVGMYCVQ